MLKKKVVSKPDVEQPCCYTPNDDPYPLCKGASNPVDFAENCCSACTLWENLPGPYDV